MISIITTCVNYSDFLSITYKYNKEEFKKNYYLIVTSKKDKATQEFCNKNNINFYITDRFYEGGARFDKPKAINDAVTNMKDSVFSNDWILLCDADVIVTPTIRYFLSRQNKNRECMYGAGRYICHDPSQYKKKKTDYEECKFLGFFQLFHKDNIEKKINKVKWFLHSNYNASIYDLEFAKEFNCKQELKNHEVLHIGPTFTNWDGRKSKLWYIS